MICRQLFDHGDKRVDLVMGRYAKATGTRGFRPDVDDVGALVKQDPRPTDRIRWGGRDAVAVGRVPRPIDHTHDERLAVGIERAPADRERLDFRSERTRIGGRQGPNVFHCQH